MRVVVLISGRGSNLKAIVEYSYKKECPYSVVAVIADSICPGLKYADDNGIHTYVVEYLPKVPKQFAEETIDNILRIQRADLVVLAGYMRILSSYLIRKWRGKIINIHPSLLPEFPGLHTHERAIEASASVHGCTVHYVDEGIDTGPIIEQQVVPVFPGDTPKLLGNRVLAEEHKLLPKVIRSLSPKK